MRYGLVTIGALALLALAGCTPDPGFTTNTTQAPVTTPSTSATTPNNNVGQLVSVQLTVAEGANPGSAEGQSLKLPEGWQAEVWANVPGARLAAATRRPASEGSADMQKILQEIGSAGPAGYATLARFRLAAADRDAGRLAEAVAAYEAIANDAADQLLADYARLQAASIRLDTAGFTDMQNRLNDLTVDGNPWRATARELLGLAALKAGKTEDAHQQFQRLLSDRDTPPSISERARIMMAMLTEAELAAPAPPAARPGTKSSAPDKEPSAPDKEK